MWVVGGGWGGGGGFRSAVVEKKIWGKHLLYGKFRKGARASHGRWSKNDTDAQPKTKQESTRQRSRLFYTRKALGGT